MPPSPVPVADVSVVLPVKNGARFLAEALESVVTQQPAPAEIIVVDGASTDGSADIARSFAGVEVVEQRGTGLAHAWNTALRGARSTFVAFIESDDRWLPGKLASQIKVLQQRPTLGYVFGAVRHVLQEGVNLPPGVRPELLEEERVAPIPGTTLVRRDVFDAVGLFDEAISIAADVDWFARCTDYGIRSDAMPQTVLIKRIHDSNLSNQARANTRELLSLLRQSVRRKQDAPNEAS